MTNIVNRLRAFSSILDKQKILQNEVTENEKLMFKLAYDPYKRYRLHFTHIDMNNLGNFTIELHEILHNLSTGKLTGNTARLTVEEFAKENGDLIKLICNKDLACGVSVTTLNKVFGKTFINKFNIQLAKEEDIDKINFPINAQLKYNGSRVITILNKGKITFKSRGGHEFSFPELEFSLLSIPYIGSKEIVLDGELTFGDSKNEDHTKISGLINSSIKTGSRLPNNKDIQYHIFDTLSLAEFEQEKCSKEYHLRMQDLWKIVPDKHNQLKIAKTYLAENKEDLMNIYNDLLQQGYEGLILKTLTHKYTYRKNKTWIKMKATETIDLLCNDYTEGEGRFEGMIGALVCTGFIGNKRIVTKVGSGLTDELRSMDPQYFIGKYIEIAYNKIIENKEGEYSLFLPRYVTTREDKS